MKKYYLFAIMAAFALVSCQNGGKTSPDVHTFGLTGDVKEVYLSELAVFDSMEEDEGDSMPDDNVLELSFDEQGRVLLDEYVNEYAYDDEGNFVGRTEWTELTRDAQGRITSFYNPVLDEDGEFLDEDMDVVEHCRFEYTYDAQGRVATEAYRGWEWGTDYVYEYDGNAFYPSVVSFEGYDAGYNESGIIEYEYVKFDDRGNWTVRTVTKTTDSWEEAWDDNEPEVETSTSVTRQYRKITYWSDGN